MRKKNKKGFTLVELLAVIVILAIILVISVPKISNVIESSKKSTFEETALNIVKAANYYYATSLLETTEQGLITFTVNNDKLMSGDNELSISGKAPVGDSWVKINEVGNVALRITDGVYYASKDFDETGVIVTEDEEAALTREELAQKVAALETAMTNLTNKESTENVFLKTYRVGSIYISADNVNPGDLYGGEWEAYGQGRTLIGAGTGNDGTESKTFAVNSTGGKYNHKLTVDEMPSHYHVGAATEAIPHANGNTLLNKYSSVTPTTTTETGLYFGTATTNTGGSGSHNNLQPYITVYMWKRTL